MVHLQLAHVKNELQLAHSVGPSDAIVEFLAPGKGFFSHEPNLGAALSSSDVIHLSSRWESYVAIQLRVVESSLFRTFFFLKKYFWIRFFNSILFAQFVFFFFSTLLHYFCEIVRRRKFVLPFVLYFIVILCRRNLLIGILEMFVHFIFSIFNFYHKFVKEGKNNI